MQRRIYSLFIVFSLIIIFLMYKGFMPREPKLIPVQANLLAELTEEIRADYPEVDKVEAQIFNDVLEVNIACKGILEDLKTQAILRAVKNNILTKDIEKSKYRSIEVRIFNANSSYRYSTEAPLGNNGNLAVTWKVFKTVIINDKEINSEAEFQE